MTHNENIKHLDEDFNDFSVLQKTLIDFNYQEEIRKKSDNFFAYQRE